MVRGQSDRHQLAAEQKADLRLILRVAQRPDLAAAEVAERIHAGPRRARRPALRRRADDCAAIVQMAVLEDRPHQIVVARAVGQALTRFRVRPAEVAGCLIERQDAQLLEVRAAEVGQVD